MSVTILSTNENKSLERKEIRADVSFEGPTPKRVDVKQLLCGKVAANPEHTVIRSIKSNFGRRIVHVTVHVYSGKDVLMKTEPDFIKVREGMMEKKKKEKKVAAKSAAKKK